MFKDIFIKLVAYFVKVIHVKLPHERGEVAVSEINGKNLLFKFLDLKNGKTGALFIPCNDLIVLTALSK